MKTYGGGGSIAPPFLSRALDGGGMSASRPGRSTSGKESQIPTGWVGPKAGLDAVEYRKISCPYRESVARRYTD
jgi:hypothetical protein